MDANDRSALLGQVNITISDIIRREKMEYSPPQPFVLQAGTGTITLSAKLKGLKKANPKKTITSPVKASEDATPTTQVDTSINAQPQKDNLKKEESMKSTISGVTEPLADYGSTLQSYPSLDEVMSNTIDPMIKMTGNDVDLQDLMVEGDCGIRQRSNIQAAGPCGKIKVSLSYHAGKEELNVTVHEARGLPGGDLPDPPDPYVKLYLLPERSKKSKRKSDVKKDTVNPTYDETFEYDFKSYEMQQQQLEVSVVDRKGIFARGSLMGRVVVSLADVETRGGITEWYQLEEDDDDSD